MIRPNLLRAQALWMVFLMVSLPVVLAEQLDLEYDPNGNLVSGDGFHRTYNELNQLVEVREGNTDTGQLLEKFTWHPTEERILIKDVYENGSWNSSVYYVTDEFIRVENGSGNHTEKYIYQDGVLVAQVDSSGATQAIHPDHLGSTGVLTDASGSVIDEYFYSPYGEQLEDGGARFGYEGKEFDSKTQDTDFHFRKYRPDWGRFTQPDTLLPDVYDPQQLNRYAFEQNSPYRMVEQDGHFSADWIVNAFTAVVHTFLGGVLTEQYEDLANEAENPVLKDYFQEQSKLTAEQAAHDVYESIFSLPVSEEGRVTVFPGIQFQQKDFDGNDIPGPPRIAPTFADLREDKAILERYNQALEENEDFCRKCIREIDVDEDSDLVLNFVDEEEDKIEKSIKISGGSGGKGFKKRHNYRIYRENGKRKISTSYRSRGGV